MALVYTPALLNAQTTVNPPLSQQLVREGTLAVTLAGGLKVGTPADEVEAESMLGTVGISPRNGWIADYPVTPDIIGELQTSIIEAADASSLAIGKDEAVKAFQDIMNDYMLNVSADISGQETVDTAGPEYPDVAVINDNYNTDAGPPVVTYYAPPPDYAYLYTWVPYPFWWRDVWLPGFFVLSDFDIRGRSHGHERGRELRQGEIISNHFHDPGTGRTLRIDPANRPYVITSASRKGIRSSDLSAQGAAKSDLDSSRNSQTGKGNRMYVPSSANLGTPVNRGHTSPVPAKEFRGYEEPNPSAPSAGTRSSAFDHSVDSQSERAASDRGFQSRSNAGQIDGGTGSSGLRGTGSGGFNGGGRR